MDSRAEDDRRNDEKDIFEGHEVERLKGETRTLRDFKDNPRALAAYFGLTTSDETSDPDERGEVFGELLERHNELDERIQDCQQLDEAGRNELLHDLNECTVSGDDPFGGYVILLRAFRRLVVTRHPGFPWQPDHSAETTKKLLESALDADPELRGLHDDLERQVEQASRFVQLRSE